MANMIRGLSQNGGVVFCDMDSTNIVRQAEALHHTSATCSAALGRLLTGASMMGMMLKGEKDMLTLQIAGDGPIGGITVTADALGHVKGYAKNPQVMIGANEKGKLDVAKAVGKGMLRVIKDMGLKEPYVGQTVLESGEIAEDLTYYFANSEQVPSSVGLGVLMDRETNTVKQAGGFIIQLMPFADEELISRLESNLGKVDSVTKLFEEGKTPQQLLELLLEGLTPEILEEGPVEFFCNCDKERVEKALISLGKQELEELIAEGKEIELNCHFCGSSYVFSVEELKTMLKRARG